MNSEKSNTSDEHRLKLNLTEIKINKMKCFFKVKFA